MDVLIVCTANQCRSPMAEFLLRERITRAGLDWSISSAGTHATVGYPMHRNTAKLLRSRQIDVPDTWQTHPIDRDLLAGSDLILAATRAQRSMIVERVPSTLPKAFTILQFARYAKLSRDAGQWDPRQSSAELLDGLNRSEPAGNPSDDDLDDPVGRWYRPFKICAAALDDAFDRILGDRESRPADTTTRR